MSFKRNKRIRFLGKILFVLYIVGTIGGIVAVVYGLMNDNMSFYRNGINLVAFVSSVSDLKYGL